MCSWNYKLFRIIKANLLHFTRNIFGRVSKVKDTQKKNSPLIASHHISNKILCNVIFFSIFYRPSLNIYLIHEPNEQLTAVYTHPGSLLGSGVKGRNICKNVFIRGEVCFSTHSIFQSIVVSESLPYDLITL